MPSAKIDLGNTPSYASCSPLSSGRYYPTLYVSREADDKGLQGLPAKGKATVEYRVRSRTVSEDEKGNKRTSVDIEVHSIEPIAGKVKELSAKIDAHLTQFDDTRPRDQMGQFSGAQTQGLDPMTMKQAYKKRRIPSLARLGGMIGRGLALP